MSNIPDQKDKNNKEKETEKKPETKPESEKMQQRSDPQITELKGLTDPEEPLEVEGTDNPV